jgi:dihydrodipicolinate synthase/N-acetylneuraminate lyase
MHWSELPEPALAAFRNGTVIPAHPLALDQDRRLDRRRQRALARYYIDAGAGGLAVGVHSTQFAIREAGLYRPVLEIAAETAASWSARPIFMIAGVAGRTPQALDEALTARSLGYHAVLVSLAAFKGAGEDEMIDHCLALEAELPLVGFYLQPAVGGVPLGRSFWRRFAGLDNVIGIKVAPFDRYRTLDVATGVAEAGASGRIALYTGNDDHIILDLCAPLRAAGQELRFVGGLLGQWSVWTSVAVQILERCKAAGKGSGAIPADLLALDSALTACNAAIFDAANGFRGVIPGCHEILRRQGLLAGRWCLDPNEKLSPGQAAEIDRVVALYPELTDDAFVASGLDRWLA